MSASGRNAVWTEIVFSFLPILIVCEVALRYQSLTALLHSPEWAFGATILFGQSMARIASVGARGGSAALGLALLLTFGIVPSLFFLHEGLSAEMGSGPDHGEGSYGVSSTLLSGQLVLYALALGCYYFVGNALAGEDAIGKK